MSGLLKYAIAFAAACIVPALVVVAPVALDALLAVRSAEDGIAKHGVTQLGVFALAVSAGHVLLLGLPACLWLRWRGVVSWWSTTLVGFVLACMPIAVWLWPLRYGAPGRSAGYVDGDALVQTMIDGVPTLAGWLQFSQSVALVGLFGAIGGLAFWTVWHIGGKLERTQ